MNDIQNVKKKDLKKKQWKSVNENNDKYLQMVITSPDLIPNDRRNRNAKCDASSSNCFAVNSFPLTPSTYNQILIVHYIY